MILILIFCGKFYKKNFYKASQAWMVHFLPWVCLRPLLGFWRMFSMAVFRVPKHCEPRAASRISCHLHPRKKQATFCIDNICRSYRCKPLVETPLSSQFHISKRWAKMTSCSNPIDKQQVHPASTGYTFHLTQNLHSFKTVSWEMITNHIAIMSQSWSWRCQQ